MLLNKKRFLTFFLGAGLVSSAFAQEKESPKASDPLSPQTSAIQLGEPQLLLKHTGPHSLGTAVIDLNNDGKKDLLYATIRGDVFSSINEGTKDQPKFSTGVALKSGNEQVKIHHW